MYDLEDEINKDKDYWLTLFALYYLIEDLKRADEYELVKKVEISWKRISEDYIDFRLNQSQYFQSEGRKVIREVYKILGYNPFNPKKLK